MPPPTTAASEEARRSHALESLTAVLRSAPNLYLVDFGAANQANLDYFLGLGHQLYSEDLLRRAGGTIAPERAEDFFSHSLNFPDQTVDAVLLWDVFQFLPTGLQPAFVDRLYRVMAPGSHLFAVFHPDHASGEGRSHAWRVLDAHTLHMVPKSSPRAMTPMNNRNIERVFQRFAAVKFFLTREHLREVLVQR